MTSSRVMALVARDLLRKKRNPTGTVILLLFPIIFAGILGLAFGNQNTGGLSTIQVLYVDEDSGFVGSLLNQAFRRPEMADRFAVRTVEREEGRKLMARGKASAMLLLPRGFTDSLFAASPDTIFVLRNPSESIKPAVVEEGANVLALVLSSVSRVLGQPIERIREMTKASGKPADEAIGDVAIQANRQISETARFFFPPLVRLQTAKDEKEEKGPTGIALVASYVLPGISVLALLMIGQISMRDILREEATGTLRRMLSTPTSVSEVILGKIGSTGLVAMGSLLVLSVVGALMGTPAPPVVPFLVLSLAFVAAVCGFVALVYSLARNERQGTTFGEIVVMAMAFAGGSWVPLESLDPRVRLVSPFTLNYWAVDGYRKLLFEDGGWGDVQKGIVILFAIGIVATVLGAGLLRRRLLRGVS